MLNVPLIISSHHMVPQYVCVRTPGCVLFYKCHQVGLSTCLSECCFLFIHLRSDWHDAELMRVWKQSGSVDYLWVCLWHRVPPWCQCKKFTLSAVWMLIVLLEYQIQPRRTVRARRGRTDSEKKVRREWDESNEQNGHLIYWSKCIGWEADNKLNCITWE